MKLMMIFIHSFLVSFFDIMIIINKYCEIFLDNLIKEIPIISEKINKKNCNTQTQQNIFNEIDIQEL